MVNYLVFLQIRTVSYEGQFLSWIQTKRKTKKSIETP